MNEQINAIIGDMLEYKITRNEAVGRIEDLYARRHPRPNAIQRGGVESVHWVDCSKKTTNIDIFHVFGCNGANECELTPLIDKGDYDDQLRKGRQYDVQKSDGTYHFKDTGPSDDNRPKVKKP